MSRVKKRDIVNNLRRLGFKTQSELNEILPEKKRPSVQQENAEEEGESKEQENAKEEEEEVVAAGEVSIKEYDYLLTMQILSLTEERVIELEKQMRDKRADYERLKAMHIYEIWKGDLENFLQELDKYEAQEEKDRLAHTAAANGGKGKGKGGAAKARKPATTAAAAGKKPVNNENKKPLNQVADGNSD